MAGDHARDAATEGRGKATLLDDRVGDQTPCGFAFPKGSRLVGDVNGVLGKLRADGRYQAAYKKSFGDAPQFRMLESCSARHLPGGSDCL